MWTSAPAVVPVAMTPSPDLVPPAPSKPALAIPLGGENPSAEPQGLLAGRPVGLMMDYDEDKEVASPGADSDVVVRKLDLEGVSMGVEPQLLALLVGSTDRFLLGFPPCSFPNPQGYCRIDRSFFVKSDLLPKLLIMWNKSFVA